MGRYVNQRGLHAGRDGVSNRLPRQRSTPVVVGCDTEDRHRHEVAIRGIGYEGIEKKRSSLVRPDFVNPVRTIS